MSDNKEDGSLMTIEKLAEEVNRNIKTETASDKRRSNALSVRRIRDYLSKGLMDKPIKDGRSALFGKKHLEQLIALRGLQSEGLSDQYMKKMSDSLTGDSFRGTTDSLLRNSALNAISLMGGWQALGEEAFGALIKNSLTGGVQACGSTSKSIGTTGFLRTAAIGESIEQFSTLAKTGKIWQEFKIDDEGSVFLRLEYGKTPKDLEKIISNIKDIFNVK